MIIKGSRNTISRARNFLLTHILQGAENDLVRIVAGGAEHLEACIRFCEEKRPKVRYAIRHWIIAPDEPMTDTEAFAVVVMLARAFAFDASRVTLVRHEKPRHGLDEEVPHFHLCVAETDPDVRGGRVLTASFDYLTHETTAREAEYRFGHRCTPGPHHARTIRQAEREGRSEFVAWLREHEASRQPEQPPTSYGAGTAAQIARAGMAPAAAVDEIRAAFEIAANGREFLDALAGMGCHLVPGEADGVAVVMSGDHPLDALHVILGARANEVAVFFASGPRPPEPPPPQVQAPPIVPVADDLAPVPPPAAPLPRLTATEMGRVYHEEVQALTPQPQDTEKLRRLTVTAKAMRQTLREDEGRLAAAQAERDAALARAERAGAWWRRLLRRRTHQAAQDRLQEARNMLRRREGEVREQKATADRWGEEALAERRRIDNCDAVERERCANGRARLAAVAEMIRRERRAFASADELRTFLRTASPYVDEDPGPTITWRPG